MLAQNTQRHIDPDLPTLQVVLDPCRLAKHLSGSLPGKWGAIRDIQIQVLRHHPASRCSVEIQLQTTTGRHELIGKVYPVNRADVYRAMEEISQSGFGPGEEFSIPQPYAFIPELHLLLQQKISGLPATEIFLTADERGRAEAAERCAKWLSSFQSQAPLSAPVSVFTHKLLQRWLSRIVKRAKPLTDKAHQLFERLDLAASALERTEMCAGHGSYCHQQIIFTDTGTVTFDWDNHSISDPARDVARFIFTLQRSAVDVLDSIKALDGAIETFYETYRATSMFDVAKHLPFYKAAYCLKLVMFRQEPSRRIEKTEALLDEGLRILEEEV